MDLDEVAGHLYGLPPEEFTTARDDIARRATDPTAKKAVKALRKPTAAAHAVNTLIRERPEDVDELLAVGADLREAMGHDAGAVRRLTEQRRSLVASLVDRDLPAAVQQDVAATLEAATADPSLAQAVRSGRLVRPLHYAGFGALPDLDDAVAGPAATRARPGRRTPAVKKAAAKEGRKATKQATTDPEPSPDLTALRQHVLDLAGAADDAQRRYELTAAQAEEARKLLERAEGERADAHRAARAAHAEAEKARRELGRLERR